MTANTIQVRVVRTQQAGDVAVYAFFLPGAEVLRFAEISRIEREEGELKGFQRKEIKSHVKAIMDFLGKGPVLFPNAIILALSPDVKFELSRGSKRNGRLLDIAQAGYLHIPTRPEGRKWAWIVDGQQRSLALSKSESDIPVPVIGFVSSDLEIQREQFILVNKAKPLPMRLIDELLPEVSALPHDLSARRLPSEIVNTLNKDPASPFHQLIKRESTSSSEGVVTDSALLQAIQANLKPPAGALSHMVSADGEPLVHPDSMYSMLVEYWSAVRDTFPDAWGKSSVESRLMHSTGIRAMGALMDYVGQRAYALPQPQTEIRAALARIAPHCAWTGGVWQDLGLRWNELQSTPQHLNKLRDHLVLLDRKLSRPGG